LHRPVWLISMDSEGFHAPPTTTAALSAYYQAYGDLTSSTDIELVHFQQGEDIGKWLSNWEDQSLKVARAALSSGQQPIIGFSFYTWNAAEFLDLAKELKALLPELLIVAGGPHIQQAEDYLGIEAIDLVFLGEAEVTFAEFLDCDGPEHWPEIDGLAYLVDGEITKTTSRARCTNLDSFPSPLNVLELADDSGQPLYESISYETSRGCPFKCAFCEWGTGAIGSKMYQWSMERIRDDWEKIVGAGIKDIWLADSNFGALKQDLEKARLLVGLKERTGLPVSFATSWSKKHSRKVQEIALLLHQHSLLPHYQLALQTLTPEALKLSNRENMSSNEYKPIAKSMSEQGVPIAAELIWGLPGDNLADFEKNLDELLASFPNINIFGYTLLPGTEFYERREEYQIDAIPVAGYGKAKGEYVVGCHTFDRDEGEEGYFLISSHILLVHGHIMPLTTRWLALQGKVPVSPLFRQILRAIIAAFSEKLVHIDLEDRMAIYEGRDAIYLEALANPDMLYQTIAGVLQAHHEFHGEDAQQALKILELDQALCPRAGSETSLDISFDFDANHAFTSLAAMDKPVLELGSGGAWDLRVQHPGGVGEILQVADGGSWLRGVIEESKEKPSDVQFVAIA
jgi:Radical SAM superfamily/B12 binding domain